MENKETKLGYAIQHQEGGFMLKNTYELAFTKATKRIGTWNSLSALRKSVKGRAGKYKGTQKYNWFCEEMLKTRIVKIIVKEEGSILFNLDWLS